MVCSSSLADCSSSFVVSSSSIVDSQLLVGRLEVAPAALELVLQRGGARDVLERDGDADRLAVAVVERRGAHREAAGLLVGRRERRLAQADGAPLAQHLLDDAAQVDRLPRHRLVGEQVADRPSPRPKSARAGSLT